MDNNSQGELDYELESEIDELQMAELEAGRYIYVCKKKIEEWEQKLKKAEERLKYRKESSKHNIYSKLNKAIADGVINETSMKQSDTMATYSIPSAKLIYHKEVEKIEKMDDEKLLIYLKNSSKWDYVEIKENVKWRDFKKTLKVKNGNLIDEHGEIVKIDGVEICQSQPEFEIKYFDKKK